jgi:hypothetical protein
MVFANFATCFGLYTMATFKLALEILPGFIQTEEKRLTKF